LDYNHYIILYLNLLIIMFPQIPISSLTRHVKYSKVKTKEMKKKDMHIKYRGSCLLKASVVECQSIPSLILLDQHIQSISWLVHYWHSIETTLMWKTIWIKQNLFICPRCQWDIDQVSTEALMGCWSRVDEGHWWSVMINTSLVVFEDLITAVMDNLYNL